MHADRWLALHVCATRKTGMLLWWGPSQAWRAYIGGRWTGNHAGL